MTIRFWPGADQVAFDRNFGSALAIWDWVFGTLYVPRGREELRFGLSAEEKNHGDGVVSALVSPMIASLRRLVPRRKTIAPPPKAV